MNESKQRIDGPMDEWMNGRKTEKLNGRIAKLMN
jgi:hypothetical protein